VPERDAQRTLVAKPPATDQRPVDVEEVGTAFSVRVLGLAGVLQQDSRAEE
jgi:hypothetical protein